MAISNDSDGRELMVDPNTGRVRSYGRFGIQSIRAGQTVDTGLLAAIGLAYANLVYSVVSLILLVFGAFVLITEYHRQSGPLEAIARELERLSEDQKLTGVKYYSRILFWLAYGFRYLAVYKYPFGTFCMSFVPYFTKPSTRHLVLSIILFFFALLSSMDYLEVVLLGQLYFLFANLRNPTHKFLIFSLFVLVFCVGIFEYINVTPPVRTTTSRSVPSFTSTPTTTKVSSTPASV